MMKFEDVPDDYVNKLEKVLAELSARFGRQTVTDVTLVANWQNYRNADRDELHRYEQIKAYPIEVPSFLLTMFAGNPKNLDSFLNTIFRMGMSEFAYGILNRVAADTFKTVVDTIAEAMDKIKNGIDV